MTRKITILLLVILLAGNLVGCYDYKSLDSLSVVVGIAVDKSDEEPNIFHVSFEIIGTQKSSEEEGKVSYIIESDGVSIFDAITNANKKLLNELYLGNTDLLIINEEIAKEIGIDIILENFFRGFPVLDTINVIISRAQTARSMILNKSEGKDNTVFSYKIVKTLENQKITTDTAHPLKIYEIYDSLKKGIDCITLPACNLNYDGEEPEPEIDGFAVFKGDKLRGYIEEDEKKYFSFAKEKLKGGNIVLALEGKDGHGDEYVTHGVIKSNSRIINIDYANNNLDIVIGIKVQTKLNGLFPQTRALNMDKVLEIEEKSAQELEKNIKNVIKQAQVDLGADIFGFALHIYRYDNRLWNEIKDNWDELFKNANINMNIKFDVLDTGLIINY